jgi:hypothetical protein
MNKEYVDEIRSKVTDFVQNNTRESIAIGAAAFAVVGYFTYKCIYGSEKANKHVKGGKAEDSIKELDTTPGNPDSPHEEVKTRNTKFIPHSDSEDEPLILKQVVKPKRDSAGIVDRDTLVRIFDKRSTIRGIRKLDKTFKEKRRATFADQAEYKNIISYYHFEIEKKRENNLEYICRAINVSIEDIENSQEKYFGDSNLAFIVGTKEFQNAEVPSWLTLDKALEIYDDLKEMLQAELIQLNSKAGLGEEARELEMVYIQYKMQDILYNKYKVEEEHVKKVLYDHGIAA